MYCTSAHKVCIERAIQVVLLTYILLVLVWENHIFLASGWMRDGEHFIVMKLVHAILKDVFSIDSYFSGNTNGLDNFE